MEISEKLEYYIKLQTEDKESMEYMDKNILNAMIGMYYLRLFNDENEGFMEYISYAEYCITELHSIIDMLRTGSSNAETNNLQTK